ncbi:MAG: IS110 family transposase [Gammaproteobacteria bacterium]|nr:IS110 family transposase [Gammaproteobacteria bacterium]NIR96786.1 IS110 family transposase [Gammaproteobacteria bacterium]NIT62252.1 IS110 family transposase [Gammaproteobacteria bacterium]NIV19426.1 IS110 family transposase [Gammaproteobacteria bacterium]NIY30832.1 IS110 family transposase [Gammaproteobacteria bacterium]
MAKVTVIGLDLAKNVFHVVCCDGRGKVVGKKRLKRAQVLDYFAKLEGCVVGMEACAGAHYWGRQLKALGHQVKLLPPLYVKAYVRGNKNDYNDALAIAEAVVRPQMRFVALKTPEQQDIQALHRLRERRLQERTALCNQVRGLLGEYGLVLPKGVNVLRRRLPELLEDAENGLSDVFRRLLAESYRQLRELDAHIEFYATELARQSRLSEACQRLETIPGYGPIVASVFHSVVGDGSGYRRGRDVAAAVGLVPRQHSSGGKQSLGGMSKRGDRYLRSLLIHGARSVVVQAAKKNDPLSRWVNKVRAERGFNKAAVALANKMARIGWAVLHNKTVYQAV